MPDADVDARLRRLERVVGAALLLWCLLALLVASCAVVGLLAIWLTP